MNLIHSCVNITFMEQFHFNLFLAKRLNDTELKYGVVQAFV